MSDTSNNGTDYDPVVCSNCGEGDWTDHDPGDSLRCPFCETHSTLTFLSEWGESNCSAQTESEQ